MRVFLSWSGDESRGVATALRNWLPSVLQSLDPWMSEEDIAAGARWFDMISRELEQAKAGVICLTPSNIDRPWLNFEAGAIAKQVSQSFACPYLLGLDLPELTGPLSLFQAVKADKDGTRKMLLTLNSISERPLSERRLDDAIDAWWPKLESALRSIPDAAVEPRPKRSEPEILEEVLLHVRKLAASQSTEAVLDVLAAKMSALSAEMQRSTELTLGERLAEIGLMLRRDHQIAELAESARENTRVSIVWFSGAVPANQGQWEKRIRNFLDSRPPAGGSYTVRLKQDGDRWQVYVEHARTGKLGLRSLTRNYTLPLAEALRKAGLPADPADH